MRIGLPVLVAAVCLPYLIGIARPARSTEQLPNVIAVVEPIEGNIFPEHRAFEGLDVTITHPESREPNYNFHPTAVASRIFTDNGLSDRALHGGHASRDRWALWSYQAQTTRHFAEAFENLGPAARIISHSAGYSQVTTGNEDRTKSLDLAAYLHRTLITQVAHNEGPGENTLLEPAGSYNAIIVGATGTAEAPPDTEPFRGLAPDAYIPSYSSRGPTSNGRTKPDLVAPGTFLQLATYDPSNPGATALTSGTSFSAPYVAGVAARLMEQADERGFNSDPLVLKSVLMNSAQEVGREFGFPDGAYSAESWDGWSPTNTTRPLDLDQGAGEVSLPRAEWQYFTNPEQDAGGVVERVGWDYDDSLRASHTQWYFFRKPVHAGATLTATLNWFREFDDEGKALKLDDLNLELWETDGVAPLTRLTQSNSAVDNVEHLHRFQTPSAGFYALAVNFVADHTKNGADPYGLAWLLPDSPFLPGDSNLDGHVNLHDFSALKSHFGQGHLLRQGDFDLDRDVDLADFLLLKANFGTVAAVPEPQSALLALCALALLLAAKWGPEPATGNRPYLLHLVSRCEWPETQPGGQRREDCDCRRRFGSGACLACERALREPRTSRAPRNTASPAPASIAALAEAGRGLARRVRGASSGRI